MARLLLAWERGGGSGHVVILAQLAQRLLARGHQVHLAWRDLEPCARLLGEAFGSERLHLWQAPVCHERADDASHPASYPELLLRAGFRDAEGLLARVRAWRRMLDAIDPALLLADYAPTALLAARNSPIAVAQIGSSFLVPPIARQPFPSFNDWQPARTWPARGFPATGLGPRQPGARGNRTRAACGDRSTAPGRRELPARLSRARSVRRAPRSVGLAVRGWPEAPDHGSDPEWPPGRRAARIRLSAARAPGLVAGHRAAERGSRGRAAPCCGTDR